MAAEDGGSVVTGEGESTAPKKPAGTVRKPHTLDQVVEAITQNFDRKGVTVAAIKNHLAKQDPSVSANVLKRRLRKALDKGFVLNLIVRPKGSEHSDVSLTGRFLVNKDTLNVIRKGKKTKSPTDDNMPPKKAAKTVKKTTANKENVAKTANKVVKAKTSVVKKTTTKPTAKSTKTTKAAAVVKAAKKTATTKTTKTKVEKAAKVSKPKSATTKTVTAKKKTATKALTGKSTTKNKMPGTPKITQPKKPRNM
ncbi:hypothetical protein LSAT2_016655 [Lamellibrachia satsuma]|nr:hypothetical protein LSAT2_016655 [Lamellibrachia satsuma]